MVAPDRGRHRAPHRWRRTTVAAVLTCLMLVGIPLLAWRHQPAPTTNPSPGIDARDHPTPPTAATPTASTTPFRYGLGTASADSPTASASPSPANRPDPPPRPGTILVGAGVQAAEGESWQAANARADAAYGPLQMHRVFYPGLPPPWSGSRAAGDGLPVVVSFKADPEDILSGRHDQRLAEWFATAPREQAVYWVYYHEPEDDIERGAFSASDYRQAWRRLADLAGQADHPRLQATLVLMCWSLDTGSGRDWRDYYPGGDVIDVLGWDCYNSDGQREGHYVDPEVRFSAPARVARAEGKPWGIAEIGSELIAGDSSGQRRAAWLRDLADYLSGHRSPPLWVAYFDSTVGGDFRLRDAPSQQAWREFIRSQGG